MNATDELLQQAVIDELGEEDTLSTTTIGVEVHNGFVRLLGTVHTLADREDADAAVGRVGGVRGVFNDLRVEREI